MKYSEFQNLHINRLFCGNILIVQANNISDTDLSFLQNRFNFHSRPGDVYHLFSDEPIHETTTRITTFTGYAINDHEFINYENYQNISFDEDFIGNYLCVEFNKSDRSLSIKSDFFTNAMKFLYKNKDLVLFSNNLLELIQTINKLNKDVFFNFQNINFNLKIAMEVSESNNYFPYFNQFNLERSEILGYEYVKPYHDLLFESTGGFSYVHKEIVKRKNTNNDLNYYVNESKKEMINAYNALSGQFPNYDFCSDLTAGADSRCLLSIFQEFGIHKMKYQVQIKGKKSVASIGMTDAHYFEYFRKRFDLNAVSLSKYINGHYNLAEYEALEEYYFERNPHQYQGIPNNLTYEELFLFRGGYGEIFRNYLGFVSSKELDSYFRRQVKSDELYGEIKNFLDQSYGFLTEDFCHQHNLNYIFFRQRETVVYNKFKYPFYNLLQSKNLYFAREQANLVDDNYALLKKIYTEELREININDKERIKDSLSVDEINIDALYDLKENVEIIGQGLIVNRKLSDEYFLEKLLSNLEFVKSKFLNQNEDILNISNLIESVERNKDSFNNWRIKNLHYRIKKLRHMLDPDFTPSGFSKLQGN